MPNFVTAHKIVMSIEGGYANDPKDRGGETYKGISRKNWPKWNGWIGIDIYKKMPDFPKMLESHSALQTSVLLFYRDNFWDINRLSDFKDFNLALELYDTGVNMSVRVAATFLQRALNVLNRNQKDYADIEKDGLIGPTTINLANNHKNPRLLYDVLNTLQGARYISICEADPTQERFMHGWLSRCYDTKYLKK